MESTEKFRHEIDGKEVRIERQFDTDVATAWRAFTDAKILDQWWAPKPWKCVTKSQDFKENGRWIYAMQGPEGEEHWSFMDYKTIVPQEFYIGEDGFSDKDGNVQEGLPRSTWKVDFRSQDNGTLVTSTCTFEKEEDLQQLLDMGFLQGYEMGLQNLEDLLPQLR